MWILWISKVAVKLHPENPYGPEGGGHSRNSPSHPHIYAPLPFSYLATASQPLRTWHPRHPEYGQLTGIPPGPATQTDKPGFEDGRTSRSPRILRAHKPVIGGLARRYVLKSMNYIPVVSQSARDGLVFHASGDIRPAHYVDAHHPSEADIVSLQASVEYSLRPAYPQLPMVRGGG